MKTLIKSTLPANSIGLWVLGALFVLNICTTVQTASATVPGGEIVLASAE
jgi:hypothetical protein